MRKDIRLVTLSGSLPLNSLFGLEVSADRGPYRTFLLSVLRLPCWYVSQWLYAFAPFAISASCRVTVATSSWFPSTFSVSVLSSVPTQHRVRPCGLLCKRL